MIIKKWIDNKLAEIAKKLPELVIDNPASFKCGFSVGYKQALMDIKEQCNLYDNYT